MQIGHDQPIPISPAPAQTGAIPWGQTGLIHATPNATIMQTLGLGPRKLSLRLGAFNYGPAAKGSIPIINAFNLDVFAVQTNLVIDYPHPQFTIMGIVPGPVPVAAPGVGLTQNGAVGVFFSAGGRSGAATVSYYAGASAFGTPGTNFGNGPPPPTTTPMAGDAAGVNGVARFTSTSNQFGGVSVSRIGGTTKIYYNVGGLTPVELPCAATAMCRFGITTINPVTIGVAGGPFGGSASRAANIGNIFTGSIGFFGTILGAGVLETTGMGAPLTFMGQSTVSVGFPLTTGMLTIEVTDLAPGAPPEKFIRTGGDNRTPAGVGVLSLVTGSISKRSLALGSANRSYVTLLVPEISSIFSAIVALLTLAGGHQLARRRL